MDFRILGPLEVLDDERPVEVGGGKQRSLLALLLLHANEPVSSDRLIDELWPDEPPPSAAKIVQAHVSRLRKAIDGSRNGVLRTRPNGYELRLAPGQLDLDRFERLLADGRDALTAGDAGAAAETLRAALALWRGPPLADFTYEPFAQEEIPRLEELRLAALEERIEADLVLGRHDGVVHELEQLVARHPLRERLRKQLMLALYRSGRHAEALEVYRDTRRKLADELGLEPSPELQQLERAILTHDPALRPPTRPRAHARASRRGLVAIGAVVAVAAVAATAIALSRTATTRGLAAVRADSVGVIDPHTNRIVAQIPVGSAPTSIAAGARGVWVTSEQDDTVTRIDPKTRTAVRTFAVGGPPVDVAIGATFVWVLSSAHTQSARITQIDPRHNAVLLTRAVGTGSVGFGSASSVAIAAGAVWVVNYEAPVSISRIDAETSEVTSTFSVGGPSLGFNTGTAGGVRQGAGIAAAQQSLWVAGDFAVARIGATSHAVVARIPLRVGVPTAVAVGAGAVWVAARPGFRCCPAEDVGTGTLTRIDPETNSIDATIPVGGTPTAVAVGEGAVWLTDPARRSVVRVDPHANRVVERIKTGAPPRGVAVGSGAVWVSVG